MFSLAAAKKSKSGKAIKVAEQDEQEAADLEQGATEDSAEEDAKPGKKKMAAKKAAAAEVESEEEREAEEKKKKPGKFAKDGKPLLKTLNAVRNWMWITQGSFVLVRRIHSIGTDTLVSESTRWPCRVQTWVARLTFRNAIRSQPGRPGYCQL
jgi:hypothetical protein